MIINTVRLGFDRVLPGRGAALLRDLVLSRIMAPASKRASAHQLELHYGRSYELDQLYRMMDALHERLDALQAIVLQATASLTAGAVQMMLFDVTRCTLRASMPMGCAPLATPRIRSTTARRWCWRWPPTRMACP